jgi:hypothetical protein
MSGGWFQTRWFLCEFPIGSYVKLSTTVQPSWSEGGTTRNNFGRGPSNDYVIKVWFQLSNWLCPAVALSHQDGRHSVVALLLKAALIQVSDYRLLGASGFITYNKMKKYIGPSWSKGRTAGHIFWREPSNDYFIKILFLLSKWFQTRTFLWEFPIGSYVKFSSETTEPISTKLCWNDPWVVPFQNYVWHFRPPTKMAATAELNLT